MASLDHPKTGGGAGGISGNTDLGDDELLRFGDDSDFGLVFDSAQDRFEIRDLVNSVEIITSGKNGTEVRIPNTSLDLSGILDMQGNNIQLGGDGTKLLFGASEDMSSRFDSGNDSLRWEDEGSGDRMELVRTNGNLNIDGTLTEGATL